MTAPHWVACDECGSDIYVSDINWVAVHLYKSYSFACMNEKCKEKARARLIAEYGDYAYDHVIVRSLEPGGEMYCIV